MSFEQEGRKKFDNKEIRATFKGANYQLPGAWGPGGSQSGTFTADHAAKPMAFDLIAKSGPLKGQAFRGIYKVDGDMLTLCFSWPPIDRPVEFSSRPNSTVVLAVFKRK